MERIALGFVVRQDVPDAVVLDAIAKALRLRRDDVALIDESGEQRQAAVVEVVRRQGGFRCSVSLYLDASRFPSLQSADVAPAIAAALGHDVIASPPRSLPAAQNPYVWLLVQPDGEQFLVDEANPNAEDLVMDEAHRRPLNSLRV